MKIGDVVHFRFQGPRPSGAGRCFPAEVVTPDRPVLRVSMEAQDVRMYDCPQDPDAPNCWHLPEECPESL